MWGKTKGLRVATHFNCDKRNFTGVSIMNRCISVAAVKEVILCAWFHLLRLKGPSPLRLYLCVCVREGERWRESWTLKPIKAIGNEPVTSNPQEPHQKKKKKLCFRRGFDCRVQSFKSQLVDSSRDKRPTRSWRQWSNSPWQTTSSTGSTGK